MSYSVNIPCWNCKKHKVIPETEGKCTDEQELQEAVKKIHGRTYIEGHQGAGVITMMCCKQDPKG